MKYQAFISYKHSDHSRKKAEALERALKRYAKPLLRPPIKIFRDEKHMVPGEGLSSLIREGLDNSEYLLFIAEKEAAKSKWCQDELEYWCKTLKRAEKLILIHIGDQLALDQENDLIDWENTNALPTILRPHIRSIPFYVDFSWIEKEPDSDLENIRYRSIINAITAKFRGVSPEEINDQEIRIFRRNRRMRNGAILILSVLLLLSSITTWWALNRNAYAQNRQKYAEQQQQIAIDRQKYAEDQQRIALDNAEMAQIQKGIAQEQEKIALAERDSAERARSVAEYRFMQAESRRLAALAQIEVDQGHYTEALLLAKQALKFKVDPIPHEIYQIVVGIFQKTGFRPPPFSSKVIPLNAYSRATLSLQEVPLLAVSSSDTIKIMEVEGTQKALIKNNTKVDDLQFSDDGKYLLAASKGGAVNIWDFNGKWITQLVHPTNDVPRVSIGGRNQVILTSGERIGKVWDFKGNIISHLDPPEEYGSLGSFEISPDETLVIGMGWWASFLWNLKKDTLLKLDHARIEHAVFSPQSRYVVTYSMNDTAKVWDRNGRFIALLLHPAYHLTPIFSPNGKMLLTRSRDGTIKLWTPEGELLWTKKFRGTVANSLQFSPDNKFIALTPLNSHLLYLMDVKGNIISRLSHSNHIYHIDFSPNSELIATSSLTMYENYERDSVKIWTVNGRLLHELPFENVIDDVKFTPDGKNLIVDHYNNIEFWNIDSRPIFTIPRSGSYNPYTFRFSQNSQLIGNILANKPDYYLNIRDINGWLISTIHYDQYVNGFKFSPDNQFIMVDLWDQPMQLRDIAGKLVNTISHSGEEAYSQPKIPFFATKERDEGIKIWDTFGNEKFKIDIKWSRKGIEFSPNGKFIGLLTEKNLFVIFTTEGVLVSSMKFPEKPSHYKFAADGFCFGVKFDNTIEIRTLQGELLLTAKVDKKASMEISPDGEQLLTYAREEYYQKVQLWDIRSGKQIKVMHFLSDVRPKFSPDGKYILGGYLNRLVILDKRGNPLNVLIVHKSKVQDAIFSPNGKNILSYGRSKRAKLWDLNGNELATLDHGQESPNLADAFFSPNGNTIITAHFSREGENYEPYYVWPSPQRLYDWLETIEIRSFTRFEKARFGIE